MAAAAGTRTIALNAMTRPSTSTACPPPRPSSLAPGSTNTPAAGSGQSTLANNHAPPPHPSPPSLASGTLPAASPSSSAPAAPPSALRRWIADIKTRKPKAKTLFEVTVAIVAIFGVVWATFVSLPSWKLQKWSAGNDFLQACLALDDPAVRSLRCNETIKLGPVAPPKWKRHLLEVPAYMVVRDPFKLAAAVVVTLGAVVAAMIYFRPRMEPFHPVVSMAREAVCGPTYELRKRVASHFITTRPTDPVKSPGSRNGDAYTVRSGEHLGAPWPVVNDVDSLIHPGSSNPETDLGQRIGLWYESDEEDLRKGDLSDSAGNDYSLSRDTFDQPSSAAGTAPIRSTDAESLAFPSRVTDVIRYGAKKHHHSFTVQTFYTIMRCASCGDFLNSLTGMQCADCKYTCHRKCVAKVITNLKHDRRLDAKSDPDMLKIAHYVRHKFNPVSNLGADWCSHCGYMLPLRRKRVRKCAECRLTFHATCVQFVPDLCGLSVEKARRINEIEWD